jgi:hypothetical protein
MIEINLNEMNQISGGYIRGDDAVCYCYAKDYRNGFREYSFAPQKPKECRLYCSRLTVFSEDLCTYMYDDKPNKKSVGGDCIPFAELVEAADKLAQEPMTHL